MEITTQKPTWIEVSIKLSPDEALEMANEMEHLGSKDSRIYEICEGILKTNGWSVPQRIRHLPPGVLDTPQKTGRYGKRGKYVSRTNVEKAQEYMEQTDKPYMVPSYLQQRYDMPNKQAIKTLEYLARKGTLVRQEVKWGNNTRPRYYIPKGNEEPFPTSKSLMKEEAPLKPPLPKELREKEYTCDPNSSTYRAMKDMTLSSGTQTIETVIPYNINDEKITTFIRNEGMKLVTNLRFHPISAESARKHYLAYLEDVRVRFKQAFTHGSEDFYTYELDNKFIEVTAPLIHDSLLDAQEDGSARYTRRLTSRDIAIMMANAFSLPLDKIQCAVKT